MYGIEQIMARALEEYEETIIYPRCSRPLPTEQDVAFVRELPLVQLVLTGRSGSLLVQSYFDRHPELIQIPTNFTYFRFVSDLLGAECHAPDVLVKTLLLRHNFRFFMDSHFNEHVVGRLGPRMKTRIVVDTDLFIRALMSCLGGKPTNTATFFYAVSTAYAWCMDQDIRGCRAILHQLHHGDWLWPSELVDHDNVSPLGVPSSRDLLPPAKLLVTVRDPTEIVRTYPTFITSYLGHEYPDARMRYEKYIRILCQDWLRHDLIEQSGIDHLFVPIESVRNDTRDEIRKIADWIGIDGTAPSLEDSSLFGQLWWGVNSASPLNGPQTPKKERASPSWENIDEPYVLAAIGTRVERFGYETLPNLSEEMSRVIAAHLADYEIKPLFKVEGDLKKMAAIRGHFLTWALDWSARRSSLHADRTAA